MATTPQQAKELLDYLSKTLNLPEHLVWLEIRIATNEAISVKCEFLPDVEPPDAQD